MTAKSQADVVVAGHLCLDIIPSFANREGGLETILVPGKLVTVGRAVTATGGTVSNTGLALHRLGISTQLMGKVGDDLFGDAILSLLRGHGEALIDGMILAEGEQSSYTVVVSPPGVDRMFLHCPGTNDTFRARDIDYSQLSDVRLFHFGYPPLMRRMFIDGGKELTTLMRRAREYGVTTSLDMAAVDPESEVGQADWRGLVEMVLPHVDVFLPSLEEILFMLDRNRFEQMVESGGIMPQVTGDFLTELTDEILQLGVAIVGLKLGEYGMMVRTTDDVSRLQSMGRGGPESPQEWAGRELLAPCFKANVVGATGAGDCAIAGFFAGLLRGLPLPQTLIGAVGVGAFNVEYADATSGIPSWEQLQQRLSAGWEQLPMALDVSGWRQDSSTGLWFGPHDAAFDG